MQEAPTDDEPRPTLRPATRPWAVLKFGGSSVARAGCWQRIEAIVRGHSARGHRVLVVCSALAGVSDLLEGLVRSNDRGERERVRRELSRRHRELAAELAIEMDDVLAAALGDLDALLGDGGQPLPPERWPRVLALGELLSTALGTRWLQDRGVDAWRLDARELLVAQPSPATASEEQHYLEARCPFEADAETRARLEAAPGDVVLTQGFIARDRDGDTVLLGRGGSDTAAAYLAAKLGAAFLEIWTDVPGLFTCNPHLESTARVLPRIDYDEAEAIAGFGAQVLHPRTVHPVREAGIPLRVRWTEHPTLPGTSVSARCSQPGPKAVVSRDDVCLVTIEKPEGWKPVGVLAEVATCFKDEGVPIDVLAASPSRVRVLVDLAAAGTRERLPSLLARLGRRRDVRVDEAVASVTLVGRGVTSRAEAVAPALEALGDAPPLMLSHCAADLSVTMVVPEDRCADVVHALHETVFAGEDGAPTWSELRAAREPAVAGASA